MWGTNIISPRKIQRDPLTNLKIAQWCAIAIYEN